LRISEKERKENIKFYKKLKTYKKFLINSFKTLHLPPPLYTHARVKKQKSNSLESFLSTLTLRSPSFPLPCSLTFFFHLQSLFPAASDATQHRIAPEKPNFPKNN
jgi:hypothetical protein